MGVLDGIRILELARVAPGEVPGMLLGDMGADVIKIETPEPARSRDEKTVRRDVFSYSNRNKRSIAINLKAVEGRDAFLALAVTADVVIDCFRPGVMNRLGTGYETLQALNPRIVYCAMSGFGQDGPYRDYAAHDINFLSLSGTLGLIGEPDRKPVIPLNLVADLGGASMHAALGIMFALFSRERTGRGQFVDIAYLDTTIALLAASSNMRMLFSEGLAPRRGDGIAAGTHPFYAVYETQDGKYLSVGSTEPHLWRNFCNVIGRPDLFRFHRKAEHFERAANAQEIAAREEIAAILRTRPRDEWFDLMVAADAAVGKVYDPEEVAADAQVRHRNMVVDIEHPTYGTIRQFGVPIKLSETPGRIRSAAPSPGENTEDILRELGYAEAKLSALRARGVIE